MCETDTMISAIQSPAYIWRKAKKEFSGLK
jgi:hypothetical protein